MASTENSNDLSQEKALELIGKYQTAGLDIPDHLKKYLPSPHGTITFRVNRNSPIFEGNRILATVVRTDCAVDTSVGTLSQEEATGVFNDYDVVVNMAAFPDSFASRRKETVSGRQSLGRINASYHITAQLQGNPVLANKQSTRSEMELQLLCTCGLISKITAATASPAELPTFENRGDLLGFLKTQGKVARDEHTLGLMEWMENQRSNVPQMDQVNQMEEVAEEAAL